MVQLLPSAREDSSMTRVRVNRAALPLPLMLSFAAAAVALGSIVVGAPEGHDEGWQAHLWQLLMVSQLPLIAAFVLSADWKAPRRPFVVLALYAAAIVTAMLPVAFAGL
jgi:hypothetical protein